MRKVQADDLESSSSKMKFLDVNESAASAHARGVLCIRSIALGNSGQNASERRLVERLF